MAIEDIELNVGGTSFKGVWIAIVLSMASTLGGGVWAASQFFARIDSIEGQLQAVEIPDITSLADRISLVEQRLNDQNISQLQGKLAELGANLEQIMEAQKELLDLRDRIASVEKSNGETLITVNAKMEAIGSVDDRIKKIDREINDIWNGLDAVANPLR